MLEICTNTEHVPAVAFHEAAASAGIANQDAPPCAMRASDMGCHVCV